MSAIGVAGNAAFSTPARVLTAKREHVATVTTPVRSDIGDGLETMGNAVINLLCIVILQSTRLTSDPP